MVLMQTGQTHQFHGHRSNEKGYAEAVRIAVNYESRFTLFL